MADVKKLTKKEYFGELLKIDEVAERTDLVEFINHEIELLNKKASKSTQSKTQKENEPILELIQTELTRIAKAVTITELQAESTELANYSNQKLSALLKKLVDGGIVTKTTEKKKSYFSIVD